MEKYSRWRDSSTGIQPFLPPVPPSAGSTIASSILLPSSAFHSLVRTILIAAVGLVYVVLVEGACLILIPLPPLYRAVTGLLTTGLSRLVLALMGYWWIPTEMVSSKRGSKGVTQITNRAPRRGDLIISNWTSYVDVLYLAFRYNPTFVLPVFAPLPATAEAPTKFGRHTGTGSANISTSTTPTPSPDILGYQPIPLLAILARTGQLPLTASVPPKGMYKTLKEARRKDKRPVVLLPEGTTGNGRAMLRFADGVLSDEEFAGDQQGMVWIKYFRHTSPTPFAGTATCSLPRPVKHLITTLLFTPTAFPSRSLTVRTLHPAASPSSPSFLPSEILASGAGIDNAVRDGQGAWREAISVVLAETGKVRRVRLSWVEKSAFLDYWENVSRRGRSR